MYDQILKGSIFCIITFIIEYYNKLLQQYKSDPNDYHFGLLFATTLCNRILKLYVEPLIINNSSEYKIYSGIVDNFRINLEGICYIINNK